MRSIVRARISLPSPKATVLKEYCVDINLMLFRKIRDDALGARIQSQCDQCDSMILAGPFGNIMPEVIAEGIFERMLKKFVRVRCDRIFVVSASAAGLCVWGEIKALSLAAGRGPLQSERVYLSSRSPAGAGFVKSLGGRTLLSPG